MVPNVSRDGYGVGSQLIGGSFHGKYNADVTPYVCACVRKEKESERRGCKCSNVK